jgi:hypothetical protein
LRLKRFLALSPAVIASRDGLAPFQHFVAWRRPHAGRVLIEVRVRPWGGSAREGGRRPYRRPVRRRPLSAFPSPCECGRVTGISTRLERRVQADFPHHANLVTAALTELTSAGWPPGSPTKAGRAGWPPSWVPTADDAPSGSPSRAPAEWAAYPRCPVPAFERLVGRRNRKRCLVARVSGHHEKSSGTRCARSEHVSEVE